MCNAYTNLSPSAQPPIQIFSGANCSGTRVEVQPGTTYSSTFPILSAVVPGNLRLGLSTPATGASTSLAGGTYASMATAPSVGSTATYAVATSPTTSWNDFLQQCCTGSGDSSTCGQYTLGAAGNVCPSYAGSVVTSANLSQPAYQQLASANPGSCDAAVAAYCATNPTATFCTYCKPAAEGGASPFALPSCFDQNCINSGYRTAEDVGLQCPNLVQCSQVLNVSDNQRLVASGLTLSQNCTSSSSASTPAATSTPSVLSFSNVGVLATPVIIAGHSIPLYIILAVVIAGSVLGYMLLTNDSSATSQYPYPGYYPYAQYPMPLSQ